MFEVMQPEALQASLTMYNKVSGLIIGLVSLVVIARIALLLVRVGSAGEYGKVLQDAVTFFVAIAVYPMLLNVVLSICSDLSLKIGSAPALATQSSVQGFFEKLLADSPLAIIFGSIGDLVILNLAKSIYSIFLSVLISAAPIFIFIAIILGTSGGIGTYLSLFLSLCMWPVIWNLMGTLSNVMLTGFSSSPISTTCFWLVSQLLQALSPLFTLGLMRSLSLNFGLMNSLRWGTRGTTVFVKTLSRGAPPVESYGHYVDFLGNRKPRPAPKRR